MANLAQDVIDIARRQNGLTFRYPSFDQRDFFRAEREVTIGFDLAIVYVDSSNLFHTDKALAVFGIDPKHHCAVLAGLKIIPWQTARHGARYFKPAQKVWMRLHASSKTLSAVA